MKHEPQGLERWANTDPSLHCNIIEPSGPDWRDQYMELLIDKDYEGAHELRKQNDSRYAREVEPQVTVLKSEGARLKSCRDVAIEEMVAREDSEAA